MKTLKSQLLTDFFECALAYVMKLAVADLGVTGKQTTSSIRPTPMVRLACQQVRIHARSRVPRSIFFGGVKRETGARPPVSDSRRRNSCAAPATVSDCWGVSRCHCESWPDHRQLHGKATRPKRKPGYRPIGRERRFRAGRASGVGSCVASFSLRNSLSRISACGGPAYRGSGREKKADLRPVGGLAG
jgi:hypothetical protein